MIPFSHYTLAIKIREYRLLTTSAVRSLNVGKSTPDPNWRKGSHVEKNSGYESKRSALIMKPFNDALLAQSAAALQSGDIEAAASICGLDNVVSEMVTPIIKLIFEKSPKVLFDCPDAIVQPLRTVAALMELWRIRDFQRVAQIEGEWNYRLTPERVAWSLRSHAKYLATVERCHNEGYSHTELLLGDKCHGCAFCSKLADQVMAIDTVPELPLSECTSDMGCHLYINPEVLKIDLTLLKKEGICYRTRFDVRDLKLGTNALPRWARIAFAARCARRLLPHLEKHLDGSACERAVAFAERSAETAKLTSGDAKELYSELNVLVCGLQTSDGYCGKEAETACHSAYNTIKALAWNEANVDHVFQDVASFDGEQAYGAVQDFKKIREASIEQHWTDETPVPSSFWQVSWQVSVLTNDTN